MRILRSGIFVPVSHREIVLPDTQRVSASCSWVSPLSFRSAFRNAPIFFVSIRSPPNTITNAGDMTRHKARNAFFSVRHDCLSPSFCKSHFTKDSPCFPYYSITYGMASCFFPRKNPRRSLPWGVYNFIYQTNDTLLSASSEWQYGQHKGVFMVSSSPLQIAARSTPSVRWSAILRAPASTYRRTLQASS